MNRLHLHLPHLEHNYKCIRSKLNPETALIAVVKAGGYGSDPINMAKRLEQLGVSALAVAYAQEGASLRKAGIQTPILVFYPQLEGLETLVENELEPCLYSITILEQFRQLLQEKNRTH